MTDVIQQQEETTEHQTEALLGNAGQGNRSDHVLCVGLPTLRRLLDGEAVWIEAAQAGAVAADDLLDFKREISGLLLQLDERGRRLRHENFNCDANIILMGECAKVLRQLVHIA